MSDALLSIVGVSAGYDAVDVIHGVDMQAKRGEITCLLGANGAGKSTLIKTIFGVLRPRSGSIHFDGVEISRLESHEIVRRGLVAVPEGSRVFPKMSVLDNLRVGAYLERSPTVIAANLERVFALFPRLHERIDQFAGTLSGGERSMLSIGRSLMCRPSMLVIDEPSLGLSPRFVKENFGIIRDLCTDDCAILLVEQNARQTLDISEYGYLMSQGHITCHGAASELRHSPDVARAYFGGQDSEQTNNEAMT
ncbi:MULTISPECIES: ABC transporter ATP-binding protein [Burkholderiaceae]|uniref:Branched-chain amino acid transport ATP-binding protein LivF n=1 Tax=Caballeronia sordidicola TaxID=196367 RepID=A0A242MUS2_CABSO|nr:MULTISPECIES: ABC transporter ATP-binding protein [Burkholderiaceae]AME28514.1 ABC transporter ATP-binding protein [Burkholderia sp. PAMC 26561]OTP75062.1 Branched-chain amino acid transport ATP-binding protein LivF [Caballeronia sordidicola]